MKYLIAIVVLAVVLGVGWMAFHNGAVPSYSNQGNTYGSQKSSNVSAGGVDLTSMNSEDSSAVVSQDGSADAQTLGSDGTTANSSLDAVNNPIQ